MKKVIYPVLIFSLFTSVLPACHLREKSSAEKQVIGTDSIEARLMLVTDAIEMPVEFTRAPDNSHRQFITDGIGVVRIMKGDSMLPVPFLDLRSKRAKLDKESPVGHINSIAFHPDFAINGKFFVCYSGVSKIPSHPGKLVIASFSVNRDNTDLADFSSEKTVLELEGKNIIANGAMIGFGPDGYLYISIGDDAIGDSNMFIMHRTWTI